MTEHWRDYPCDVGNPGADRDKHQKTYVPGRGMVWSHRLAWERKVGPIPPGMLVLHRCDNPPCREIHHLFLGTQGDNMRDAVAKGRHRHGTTGPKQAARGERHPMHRVTDAQREDAARLHDGGMSLRKVAATFGVCDRSVRRWLSERKAN